VDQIADARLDKLVSWPLESASASPVSVGIDVVTVASVAEALERFGQRYVRRNFTDEEAAYCCTAVTSLAASRLAARFAAKEATIKALRPERELPDWREIEVRQTSSGACALVLHGDAASLAAQRGFHHFAVSLCHEGDLAIAIVIAMRGRQGKRQAQHG